ncbi:hypothetical protein CNR22_09070 [Sphingobacteriaceae bacterium]|nr:hypothetical protein CNR22_09070 [Sphingobacteriaceae bacterium]
MKTFGQEKRFVEEVALYHLDSLTKIDKQIKYFRYFTNGYVTKKKMTFADTSQLVSNSTVLTSAFRNLSIIENSDLTSFSVPKKIRGSTGDPGLVIYRFIKHNDQYYILFESSDDGSFGQVLVILNKKGELVRYKSMLGQF